MEHFPQPAHELDRMADLLHPAGYVLMSFGPPWLHPRGHHFPLFPWAQLVFTERSLMQWRARFKRDGARKFNECEGGLNQMTLGKFERLVGQSPLAFASCECVPIGSLRPLHNRLTREFTTPRFDPVCACVASSTGIPEAAGKGAESRGRQARTPVLQHRIRGLRAEWDRHPGLSGVFLQPYSPPVLVL